MRHKWGNMLTAQLKEALVNCFCEIKSMKPELGKRKTSTIDNH
jgi:hypothetical protein